MGMFDEFVPPFETTCPSGHPNTRGAFQLKQFECTLKRYGVGDKLETESSAFKDCVIHPYSWCAECKKMYNIPVLVTDFRINRFSWWTIWEDDDGFNALRELYSLFADVA